MTLAHVAGLGLLVLVVIAIVAVWAEVQNGLDIVVPDDQGDDDSLPPPFFPFL